MLARYQPIQLLSRFNPDPEQVKFKFPHFIHTPDGGRLGGAIPSLIVPAQQRRCDWQSVFLAKKLPKPEITTMTSLSGNTADI